jgi:hypothetical protein
MYKVPVIVFCMALLCSAAQAQTLIPKVGMSLSSGSFSEDIVSSGETLQNKFGIVGGFGLEIPLKGKFAIQPELLFAQKGWKDKETDSGITAKGSTTLNYLEIPVIVKAKFGGFYLNAGPSLGIGLNGKYKYSISDGQQSESGSGDIKFGKAPDNDNSDTGYVDHRTNVGLQLGAGYVIAEKVMIDLRYGFGLSNLFDKETGFDNKSKLRSFQVTVGVPIKLGK